ncbi:MAG: phosphonopyruvate decarboxylase [Lachnospiraceae bacterium]|nr:phosphonopyruvate decarboxylase [Lachnospiraceae bacterium]MDD7628471.1 phosphonopyruvate decarboxylase [Lachnospiraceae bacterium]MDY4119997.1 phosphonopyruvate decarboxylase [Lachnospiraceae bacterium]
MKACELLKQIEERGIDTIAGVPDSTLKQFCDGIQNYKGALAHYVTANEGAAVGVAIGSFLASGKPACVYMQNSGIGNAVNPLASLANGDVYGVPILFIVGWRGEPGVKDEPQHVFQGKITCELFDTLAVPYRVVDKDTTDEEMRQILDEAFAVLRENRQYAIIVKKGTFEKADPFVWKNENQMVREAVLGRILEILPEDAVIVSTTGKISRELYEQSNQINGNHDQIFMTVGGMGHASMIAFGIAQKRPDKKVLCIDGDGAVLMHMGALPFIASQAPANFYHIVINNQAHESVGAMPTGCQQADFARIAGAAGYVRSEKLESMEALDQIAEAMMKENGPILFEIPVSLDARADLGRPKESARENKEEFMKFLERE